MRSNARGGVAQLVRAPACHASEHALYPLLEAKFAIFLRLQPVPFRDFCLSKRLSWAFLVIVYEAGL